MPKITKIEVQQNNTERFNIYIDQQFAIGISMETLVHFNLKKGDIIERKKLDDIEKQEFQQHAINEALNYLSYRKRTRYEIEQHLQKKSYPPTVIEGAISFCEKQKLIDHEDYAESLKNTMIQTTDKGPEIYRQKLKQAGIEPQLCEQATEKYKLEQSLEDIVKVARKILKQKKGPSVKVKQKVEQSLLRKGYDFETIALVLEELDFSQNAEDLDNLLQRDLEKVYNKYQKKYEGYELSQKTIAALLRKGYHYEDINQKLEESGISHE
ncbi:recombination regulator RecX [Staphylococcus canis]|uniref:Regulatory protein RecX n=1 Tax=Staphylococcus canis TaxID=2724942 RepID=A0ABS0T7K2_9STAP|nr:recombination regulator RecX [Staphylococcus canis]MBI5974717.1 recombination regulator RecX [Staphylococcus canis]